ncbi:UNVERIFIED_CONTAM: hypothetical protein FKN15_016303 [Acipenser sinensis]
MALEEEVGEEEEAEAKMMAEDDFAACAQSFSDGNCIFTAEGPTLTICKPVMRRAAQEHPFRTSLDLELDLQASRTRQSRLDDELEALRDLRKRLDEIKARGETELPRCILEDERFQKLLKQAEKQASRTRQSRLDDELEALRDLRKSLDEIKARGETELPRCILEDERFQKLLKQAEKQAEQSKEEQKQGLKAEKLMRKVSKDVYRLREQSQKVPLQVQSFRSIQIAEPVGGKLKPSRIVVIRFMEFEATVMGVAEKVKEALASEEPLVLTDVQGNEIIDSEGTRGSIYWKQNSRKVFAVLESYFHEFTHSNKRRRIRSIQIAEPVDGKLKPSRIVVIRFMEFEATVMGVAEKVKEALASEEPLVLTDVQGNEILDSEGTYFFFLINMIILMMWTRGTLQTIVFLIINM